MAEMGNEDGYVNVDENSSDEYDSALQLSSDESEIDVEADDLNEDAEGEDGDESPNRRDHHNDLEKRRRKHITESYTRLKKVVKRVGGDRKGLSSCGRDRTLQIANHLLKEELQKLRTMKRNARKMKAMLQEIMPTLDNELRVEFEEHIADLKELGDNTIQMQPLPPELRATDYIKEEGEESEEEYEHNCLITMPSDDDLDKEQRAVPDNYYFDEEADEEGWATSDEYASGEDSDDTTLSQSSDKKL